MRARLRDLSIKTKLALVVAATTLAAVAAIGAILAASEFLRYRDDTVAVLRSHAQVTAINASAAVAFRDAASAHQTLSALGAVTAIRASRIYDASGSLFTSMQDPQSEIAVERRATRMQAPRITLSHVTLDHPIQFSDSTIGFVRIDADFRGYFASMRRFGVALLVAAVGALGAALALLIPLRNAVARPIEGLARLVGRVRGDHDYSLRAVAAGRDELGSLAESFNAMLEVIEQRDTHLAAEREQLRHAKEAAEAANLSKSRFLANMSHEIRTPMNGILGMAYVMQSSARDDVQRHYLETIVASGEALLRILNDILDFSKIEAGRLDIVRVPFPLHENVDDVIKVFAAEGRAKGLSLTLEIDPSVPMAAVGDSLRIRQVLSNLVGNAIKFTPAGGVTVTVEVESRAVRADGQIEVKFSVADTGIGVTEDAQATIFDAFTQADSTTQREHGGTGLGLTISRQLVTMMGGVLGLASRSGYGSTFWFTIPLGTALPQPTATPSAEAPGESGFHASILLVEDNPVNVQVVRAMMKRTRCRITVAKDGREALAALEKGPFDLVLMDCQMPVLDGYETTRIIRDRERVRGGRQRIVAVTAHALIGDREACLAAGMDDYMSKPFSFAQMKAMLAANLPTRDVAGAAALPDAATDEGADEEQFARAINELEQMEAAGNPGLVARIASHFAHQAVQARGALERAVAGSGLDAAARVMHGFGATAAHLGGRRLHRLCQEIERACAAGDAAAVAMAARQFEPEVNTLRALTDKATSRASAPAASQAPQTRRTLRALLVDDSGDDRLILGHRLRGDGFEVIESENAAEGLRAASEMQPDVVLLDRKLGDDDGIELVPSFVSAGKERPLAVILVTAASYSVVDRQAHEAGAVAVIEKSTGPGFPAAVRAALAKSGRG